MMVKQHCGGNEEHSSEGLAVTGESKDVSVITIRSMEVWLRLFLMSAINMCDLSASRFSRFNPWQIHVEALQKAGDVGPGACRTHCRRDAPLAFAKNPTTISRFCIP